MSFAILNAAAHSFNGFSLREQLNYQWLDLISQTESKKTLLRLCVAHYVKNVSILAKSEIQSKRVLFIKKIHKL